MADRRCRQPSHVASQEGHAAEQGDGPKGQRIRRRQAKAGRHLRVTRGTGRGVAPEQVESLRRAFDSTDWGGAAQSDPGARHEHRQTKPLQLRPCAWWCRRRNGCCRWLLCRHRPEPQRPVPQPRFAQLLAAYGVRDGSGQGGIFCERAAAALTDGGRARAGFSEPHGHGVRGLHAANGCSARAGT